jgi:hypothetical protein
MEGSKATSSVEGKPLSNRHFLIEVGPDGDPAEADK